MLFIENLDLKLTNFTKECYKRWEGEEGCKI